MEAPKLIDHGKLGVFERVSDGACRKCCGGVISGSCPFSDETGLTRVEEVGCHGDHYLQPYDGQAKATVVRWKLNGSRVITAA